MDYFKILIHYIVELLWLLVTRSVTKMNISPYN